MYNLILYNVQYCRGDPALAANGDTVDFIPDNYSTV